jgi:peptidoglycan/LPS O-acetylase OafA/YrhL
MNDRYHSLQILRAIAAWMVVYHHYMQLYYDFKYETIFGEFFSKYGNFGVDIFFVLSGFLMYQSINEQTNPKSFLIKRIFRIAPAYWFYTLLMVMFIWGLPTEFSYTSYNEKSLFYSLIFYPNENPSGIGYFPLHTVGWTLNFEMAFYVIIFISLNISKSKALITCCTIIIMAPLLWPKNTPFAHILSDRKIHEFLLGIIIAATTYSTWITQRSKNLTLTTSIILLIFSLLLLRHSHLQSSAMAIVFSAVLANKYINKNNATIKLLIKVGDYSYSTYLIHVFIIGIALHFFGNAANKWLEGSIIIMIATIIYIASKYSYFHLENNTHLLRLQKRLLASINTQKLERAQR